MPHWVKPVFHVCGRMYSKWLKEWINRFLRNVSAIPLFLNASQSKSFRRYQICLMKFSSSQLQVQPLNQRFTLKDKQYSKFCCRCHRDLQISSRWKISSFLGEHKSCKIFGGWKNALDSHFFVNTEKVYFQPLPKLPGILALLKKNVSIVSPTKYLSPDEILLYVLIKSNASPIIKCILDIFGKYYVASCFRSFIVGAGTDYTITKIGAYSGRSGKYWWLIIVIELMWTLRPVCVIYHGV